MIRRLLPLAVFFALALLLWAGVRMNAGRDTSAIPSPLIGKPMPVFSLPVLGDPGRVVSDKDLLGKPVLVNVWGSWCPTCRDESAQIAALASSGKLRVIGYDYKDEPADAQAWLKQFGNPYEFVIADADGRSAIDWGIYGAPESFLIDGKGIVRWKVVGVVTDAMIEHEINPRLRAWGASP